MKRQIRRGVFETNSSSVHSLTITSKEEFERFKSGELRMNWRDKFVDSTSEDFEDEDTKDYENYGGDEYEYFEKEYTTLGGDVVVAFGYHGENR
jgi:hypothetical protein